ncbi:MAG: hypothetical protein AAFV62_02230 [Pseudomonadota bacterium]
MPDRTRNRLAEFLARLSRSTSKIHIGAKRAWFWVRLWTWVVLATLVGVHLTLFAAYGTTDPCQAVAANADQRTRSVNAPGIGLASMMEDAVFYRMEQRIRANSISACYGAVIDLARDGFMDRDWFPDDAVAPTTTVP